jgi:hypothetical protein
MKRYIPTMQFLFMRENFEHSAQMRSRLADYFLGRVRTHGHNWLANYPKFRAQVAGRS